MESIIELDQMLFYWMNNDWANPIMDAVMPYWRDKKFWIPFYLLCIALLYYKFKAKGLLLALCTALTVGVGDTLSSKVIKPSIERLRPCRDANMKEVRVLVHCGSGYSFTSSHATNHFAFAVFLISMIGGLFRRIKGPLLFWAASIAIGQVYVGVHYPIDILCGSLLGTSVALIMAKILKRYLILIPKKEMA